MTPIEPNISSVRKSKDSLSIATKVLDVERATPEGEGQHPRPEGRQSEPERRQSKKDEKDLDQERGIADELDIALDHPVGERHAEDPESGAGDPDRDREGDRQRAHEHRHSEAAAQGRNTGDDVVDVEWNGQAGSRGVDRSGGRGNTPASRAF